MGTDEPYQYDPPSKYSFVYSSEKSFNPRAATQASWTPPRPRQKIDGPLIHSREFNKHPDSYISAPYGNLNWKPMSPHTKIKVKWTRHVQLFFRIAALLGAAGMLFCVICIKGTGGATGWIIRVPAAVAILHTVYAIYHLSRSSKGRTPASSASYMLFASIIDVGLIPFYVFTGLMARMELQLAAGAPGRWKTLFNDDVITEKIVRATFLTGIVNGSIHLVSLILSVYLAVLFRKISKLPPDMNPLEDNLTSRHKRNKSSIVDNRMSQATTATANSKRESKDAEPLMSPTRSVPFMHTRNDSHSNISDVPQPLFSPRVSQADLSPPFYNLPSSQRSSRLKVHEHTSSQSSLHRKSRTTFPNLMLQNQESPKQPNQQQENLHRSPTKSSSIYSTDKKPVTRFGSTASSMGDSNWITHPSPSPSPSPSPPREFRHLTTKKTSYQPLSQTSPFEYTANDENLAPLGPLEMNPPTPPIGVRKQRNAGTEQRALTPATGNVRQGSWGPGNVGIGKARAWGEMGPAGARVISRSGVEVRQGGILPNGGVRAREVSGKVMEEGRGSSNWDVIRD